MTNPAQYDRPMSITTEDNPELASAVAAKLLSDDDTEEKGVPTVAVPFIAPPPESVFKLPGGGLLDPNGVLHDEVEVKELTGADEEALSKAEVTKSMSRYITTIVKRGLVRIGAHEKPDDKLLSELLVGDREMIELAIRRATYGDELELTMVCPNCSTAVDAVYDLATEIPIRKLDDPFKRTVEVEMRDGRVAVARLPVAADQDVLLGLTGKTLAEANTVLLSRCLISIGGIPTGGVPVVQALGIMDRRAILDEMTKVQPGPKYGEVMVECPGCNSESPSVITLIDLFRG